MAVIYKPLNIVPDTHDIRLNTASVQFANLEFCWPIFNTRGANNIVDLVHGSLGVFTGTPGWACKKDPFLWSPEFNGTTEGISFPGTDTVLSGVTQFTMSAWLCSPSAASGAAYVGKQLDSTHYVQMISSGNASTVANFGVGNGAGSHGDVTFTANGFPAVDNLFHHFAMVYDGTQSTNATRLLGYIDGVARTLTFISTIPATAPTITTVGLEVAKVTTASVFSANGYYGDIRIYNTAIPAAVIWQMYAPETRFELFAPQQQRFRINAPAALARGSSNLMLLGVG